MDAILIIVLIATIGLVLLFLYDKRHHIINFLKEKAFKAKTKKVQYIEPEKDISKQKDPDTEVKPENISYGNFSFSEEIKEVDEKDSDLKVKEKRESFFGNTIFDPDTYEDDDDDEMDISQMLEEIEEERRKSSIKRYASDILEDEILPDFESMSIGELNDFLEEEIDSDIAIYRNYLQNDDDLSGEELGEALKNLPRSIKILIVTDIFNRKY